MQLLCLAASFSLTTECLIFLIFKAVTSPKPSLTIYTATLLRVKEASVVKGVVPCQQPWHQLILQEQQAYTAGAHFPTALVSELMIPGMCTSNNPHEQRKIAVAGP